MAAQMLCYGIPDIAFRRAGGATINPSQLVGHELIVFFCPADEAEAAQDIGDFRTRARAFADAGAWVIGILPDGAVPPPSDKADIMIATDPDGAGWSAFESLLDPAARCAGEKGATFLFGRGGCLEQSWAGSGHAQDTLAALQRRS